MNRSSSHKPHFQKEISTPNQLHELMKISTMFTFALAAVAIGFLTQCSPYDPGGVGSGSQYLAGYGPSQRPQVDAAGNNPEVVQGYWDGDGVQGPPKIVIVRAEQKAYFYKGSKLVGMTPISTGDEAHGTPPGNFKVTEKDIDHVSSAYGVIKNIATGEIVNKDADTRKHKAGPGEVFVNAPMPNFLRFNHGIGMHTGYLPGYAASHGCVRLPDYMARKFYENAELGTPVIVK
ncbi:hypothetical protein NT6N_03620 [Oceaniferula spumae]|uniref:L,D-TPase catalytic domain-containing protein n=1 Tax=Oceaniferula spumae TaxID=2979115 RepID=A0AAT9FH75_9BACT